MTKSLIRIKSQHKTSVFNQSHYRTAIKAYVQMYNTWGESKFDFQ